MDRSPTGTARYPIRSPLRALLAAGVAMVLLTLAAGAALAASPSPSPSPATNPDLRIEARALLGGHVRPGAWTAVDVTVSNDGPAVSGELRIRGQEAGRSQYGVQAELANGARQRFTLYAQTALFGSRVNVDLVSGDQVLATQQVPIKSNDAYTPMVAVVAERPEGLVPQVNQAMVNPNVAGATVITLTPADLPPRVEAWAAIDRLIWQDVDAASLSPAQLEALRLWLGAGGRLTIVGGTTGSATVRGFGQDILPFDPARTVDAAPDDLVPLLGPPPADATSVPALAGPLLHGAVLARSGEDVIAAEAAYGRGFVTLIGFNPAERWIVGSSASDGLWRRLLPISSGPALNPLILPDDSQIVFALQNLPAIDLPPIEQLFVLLAAYIALIGPVNYLVLRRLDKREWAWITIPCLVVIFAAGSYGLGATLKGSDVIINEIAVVRAAQDTGRGIGQAYVGIYSPSRRTFEVSIPGGALISNPTSQSQLGQAEQPLDVLFGESASRLRGFEVGFGVLRGFRAEAPASAPRIESDLSLSAGKLRGTITNGGDKPLENVAILFGGGVAVVPLLGPGETRSIDLEATNNGFYGYAVSERIFGSTFPRDPAEARTVYTRRAVIDQLFPYGSAGGPDNPLLLAWRDGPVLDVQISGDAPNRVGDGLFVIPLGLTLDADQAFTDQIMRRTIVDSTAAQGWGDSGGYYMSRGTMTLEARPLAFAGSFRASSLELAITQGDQRVLRGAGKPLAPLPDAEQPDQDDPLGEVIDPPPGNGGKPDPLPPGDEPRPEQWDSLPDFQLFDHVAQRWIEFPHPEPTTSYMIATPERYADQGGAIRFRFVNRGAQGDFGEEQRFQLLIRAEGTIS